MSPSVNWNEFNWGEENWGYTGDVELEIGKFLSESQAMTSTVALNVGKSISNTLTPTEDLSGQELTDGSGYNYVFRSDTTQGEDRDFASWTTASGDTETYTCQAAASTTWSEA
jgi:hypothetical protein